MSEETNIVPFGKHKGKPIEALIADQDYVSWLQQQSWFRERYGNIYNIVVMGRSKEEEETPEHNKIQTMFLDKKFREKFMRQSGYSSKERTKLRSDELAFESGRNHDTPPIDVIFDGYEMYFYTPQESVSDLLLRIHRTVMMYTHHMSETSKNDHWKEFTNEDWSSEKRYHSSSFKEASEHKIKKGEPRNQRRFYIEIKPTIGDDYPSVFRQMKRNHANFLLVGEYTGVGATKEQFIEFFKTGSIEVVFLADVLKQQVE